MNFIKIYKIQLLKYKILFFLKNDIEYKFIKKKDKL